MLSRPAGLSDDTLRRVLDDGWGLTVASIEYRAVGFGSHHWDAVDRAGVRWFVTVDDLENDDELRRLRAALTTATALRAGGASFVVAPMLNRAGEPLQAIEPQFAVALYPHVHGRSFAWDDFSLTGHRRGVLDLLVELHTAPRPASRHALTDDFTIPHRDALDARGTRWEGGPYATPAAELLDAHADQIGRGLARYDELVAAYVRAPAPVALTHGEPHPANTMLTAEGFVLVDWDTVLIAPPERDLWDLDPGDGSILGAYADATGTTPRPALLELYRIRWDLADMAEFIRQFRARHSGSRDDEKAWDDLCALVARC